MAITLGRYVLEPGRPPVIIAELSGNHNGSLESALQLVDQAAAAGAQAVKLQTYTADTMTLDLNHGTFYLNDQSSLWHGESLYSLYSRACTPWDWHAPLFDRARRHDLIAFSSVFDRTSVEFLESFDVPAYKIASFENTDLALIRLAAETGKLLIISTGMASLDELDEAVQAARDGGCRDLVLLKCTSSYPADPAESNLRTIPFLRDRYGCEVGLSDHTLGIGAAIASVAFGAVAIEKHMAFSGDDNGIDAAFSLAPVAVAQLVKETRAAAVAVGNVHFGPSDAERKEIGYRRSLYITEDLRSGDVLSAENVRSIRPGGGLPPKYFDQVLGRSLARDVRRGTPLSWDLMQDPYYP
jgi:pseudaminic acid synthase